MNAAANYIRQGLAGDNTPRPSFPPHDAELLRGPLVTNAKAYILADKYDIPALEDVAARMYQAVAGDQRYRRTFTGSLKSVYENTRLEKTNLQTLLSKLRMKT